MAVLRCNFAYLERFSTFANEKMGVCLAETDLRMRSVSVAGEGRPLY
jgi:hypothetical protein